jgi:predicted AlkP superfamily pyrophosphatase or phosphodiesterase
MNVAPPRLSIPQVQENLIAALKRDGIGKIDKCLIFAPDAIGQTIHEKYPDYFTDIRRIINHTEYLSSIYPSITPVCFASMFSGSSPDVHGIKKSERPVLKIDTIFDAMIRGKKKIAIIATRNSSIDLIFRNRELDYYSEADDNEVIEKALANLHKYDFIVLYNKEYDDCLHKTQPYSKECLSALTHYNQSYIKLVQAAQDTWKAYNWLLAYAPDHGAHLNSIENIGTHGKNIPEDMDLLHHYSYASAVKR